MKLPKVAIYHGSKDGNIPAETNAIPLSEALRKAGAEVELNVFPGIEHNVYAMGSEIRREASKAYVRDGLHTRSGRSRSSTKNTCRSSAVSVRGEGTAAREVRLSCRAGGLHNGIDCAVLRHRCGPADPERAAVWLQSGR